MGGPGIIKAAYTISGAYDLAAIDQDALCIRDADGMALNHKLSLYNGSVMMTYAPMRIQRYRDMPICAYEHRTVALYDFMQEAAYDEIVMP